ncbi:MAG: hypothetical protein IME93_02210 [Proteobacteria bacterium]|nr:hypothetical protein [Pseudomonadota bacterium]
MEHAIKKTELNTASRVRRIAVGSIFIGIVMSAPGPLGYLAVLPLLAIYPILTGLFGEDPVDGLLANWQGGFEGECFRPSSRIALIALGGMAIGAVMISPENVGIRATLALASVYPIMAGLFGEDLLSVALGFGKERQQVQAPAIERSVKVVRVTQKVAVVGHRTATAHQHWFGRGAGPKAA